MSTLYTIYMILSGTDLSAVTSFVKQLNAGGWSAHAKTDDCIFPDFYIMQGNAVTSVGNVQDISSFSGDTTDEVLANLLSFDDEAYRIKRRYAQIHGFPVPAIPNPDLAPGVSDSVAIVKGLTSNCVPWNWAKTVIDRYYDSGLKFVIIAHRLDAYDCYPAVVMYSAPLDQADFRVPGSEHCAAFQWKTFLDLNFNECDPVLPEAELRAIEQYPSGALDKAVKRPPPS